MKVLMIGASGKFAHLVVPELIQRGVTVRALIRDEADATEARRRGADETVLGDLLDPKSLCAAMDGVDGVFHINPAFAPREAEMGVNMVNAAKTAEVRKFVFSSVIHPSISKLINHSAKQPVEEAVYESGLDYTVLQPTMYMQNLEGALHEAREHGQLTMPYSKHVKVCYVDYRDVAEVAALAFTNDTLSHGTFELCADGMVNRIEIAALMSEAIGHPVEAGETSPDAPSNSLPDGPLREGLTVMNEHYDQHGFPGGNAVVLRAILNREPRTLAQYFSEISQRTAS